MKKTDKNDKVVEIKQRHGNMSELLKKKKKHFE